MINLMKEREHIGLGSPIRSPWRSKTPKWVDGNMDDGYTTPKLGGGGGATPRGSTSTWAATSPMHGYHTAPATPRRSTSTWPDPGTDFERPRRSTARMRGSRDVAGFSTPERMTIMGRERDVVEFRTPQHPLGGTNQWGAASPLLDRHVPKESLETSYLRFNPLAYDEGDDSFVDTWTPHHEATPSPPAAEVANGGPKGRRSRRLRFFAKLKWWRKEEKVAGNDQKKRSGGGGVYPDSHQPRRWPQG